MDDTQKQPAASQPITLATQQPVVPQQPVSGGRKEAATSVQPREWVSQSTPEVVLPNEVKEAGVEVTPTVPTVPSAAQAAGVNHAKEATPVTPLATEPLGMATPKSVLDHLKNAHKKVSDSLSWLVRLIMKEQEKKENHTTSGYN